ncbi:MAG: TSCPD domain-containing protein [Proteobacteria bacterium]|nr:TSCPD domain-containing protein [Pseudomonadota bacterium]
MAIPAGWDDAAGEALAGLAPGGGAASLPEAAERWIGPIAAAARAAGFADGEADALAARLHTLLLRRRGAPEAAVWCGAASAEPGFALNLAAFHDPGAGFDVAGFAEAVETAVRALSLVAPQAARLRIGIADFDGLAAALGLSLADAAARDLAAAIAALLRGAAEAESARLARRLGARRTGRAWPAPPARCVVPGLAEAAAAARQPGQALRHAALTGIGEPGAPEALLGVAAGGIAPAFSPLGQDGGLSHATRAFMAARGLSAEAVLAAVLRGESPLPYADAAAHAALHDAVAPFIEAVPPRPVARAAPRTAAAARRDLPSRRAGYTQKAAVGKHRLFLKTGEYANGSLGEVFVTLPRDSAALREAMDGLAIATSLGLQHGVPLEAFVDALVAGPAMGSLPVEGDPAVRRAGSLADYVFRHLAVHYLGRTDLPEPAAEDAAAAPPADAPPSLPLDLPADAAARQRRRGFRVVGQH